MVADDVMLGVKCPQAAEIGIPPSWAMTEVHINFECCMLDKYCASKSNQKP